MTDTFVCDRAQVYHNTQRLSPSAIMARTGCSHIINGYLFNTKFQPLGWTVIDGRVVSRDAYTDWGVSIDSGGKPRMLADRGGTFLSGIPVLRAGSRISRGLTSDVARKAARTAVGWMADGRVLLWCDKTAMTREGLQDKLLGLGVKDALMLDGGGSTQGIFPGGKVTSTRKVPTLLLFWEQDPEPKGERPMVEINAYSKAKDGSKRLSANFRVSEFACKDGSDAILVAPRLVMVLQSIRSHFGAAVTVNSAYRTPQYNEKVSGAAQSQHCYGTAADITVKGKTPAQVAAYARSIMPDWGGVGTYRTFTHVDVRDAKADWKG